MTNLKSSIKQRPARSAAGTAAVTWALAIDATGKAMLDQSSAPRQALHAGRLRFVHPITKETIDLGMVMPTELKHWLDRLRRGERH